MKPFLTPLTTGRHLLAAGLAVALVPLSLMIARAQLRNIQSLEIARSDFVQRIATAQRLLARAPQNAATLDLAATSLAEAESKNILPPGDSYARIVGILTAAAKAHSFEVHDVSPLMIRSLLSATPAYTISGAVTRLRGTADQLPKLLEHLERQHPHLHFQFAASQESSTNTTREVLLQVYGLTPSANHP